MFKATKCKTYNMLNVRESIKINPSKHYKAVQALSKQFREKK